MSALPTIQHALDNLTVSIWPKAVQLKAVQSLTIGLKIKKLDKLAVCHTNTHKVVPIMPNIYKGRFVCQIGLKSKTIYFLHLTS